MAINQETIQKLNDLLKNADFSNTTEEGVGSKLPDGYYLCQVSKAELTQSKNGNPMVVIEYVTLGDGKKTIVDDSGYSQLVDAPHTSDKKVFVNYVISTEMNLGFFVSDMLKFQDPETDESLFDKNEDFKNAEAIDNVCGMLEQGGIVYLMLQTVEKDGQSDQRKKPISWKRARKLELF
jgi:hypothetical protein